MENFVFTPTDGFANKTAYPDPVSEDETREMLMRPSKQIQNFMNTTVVPAINGLYGTTGDAAAINTMLTQITAIKTSIETTISNFEGNYWKKVYPVGAIYISTTNSNPATLFGGTWQRIRDKFLLSAGNTYQAGTEGGEATHKLTREEIPNYELGRIPVGVPSNHTWWNNKGVYGRTIMQTIESGHPGVDSPSKAVGTPQYGWEIDSYGGDTAHNNMPPYLAVYVWERTA